MQKTVVLAIAAILAGCAPNEGKSLSETSGSWAYIALKDAETDSVKSEVARQMKDPYSAQFEDIRATKNGVGIVVICGRVNAKNSFGGYTGARLFFGKAFMSNNIVSGFRPDDIASDAFDDGLVRRKCREAAIVL